MWMLKLGKPSFFTAASGSNTARQMPRARNTWPSALRRSHFRLSTVTSDWMTIQRVSVYCASSRQSDPVYFEAAHRLGRMLAAESITIVYGGGAVGSMGHLADGALAAGGGVIGVASWMTWNGDTNGLPSFDWLIISTNASE